MELGLQVQLVDIASNCLSSQAALSLRLCPEQVQFYEACLWELPDTLITCDYFTCVDVLEHIPPKHVEATLKSIALKQVGLGFFGICLGEDQWGKAINETLHLSIFTREQWLKKLKCHWSIVKSELAFDDQYLLVIVDSHN